MATSMGYEKKDEGKSNIKKRSSRQMWNKNGEAEKGYFHIYADYYAIR